MPLAGPRAGYSGRAAGDQCGPRGVVLRPPIEQPNGDSIARNCLNLESLRRAEWWWLGSTVVR
jgi:hypothetical protein